MFYTILNEEYDDLSTLYWIRKLHTFRERYIISSTCSTKMSITLTKNSVCSPRGILYCDNSYSPSSIKKCEYWKTLKTFWMILILYFLMSFFGNFIYPNIRFFYTWHYQSARKILKKNSLKEIIHNTFYFKNGWQG